MPVTRSKSSDRMKPVGKDGNWGSLLPAMASCDKLCEQPSGLAEPQKPTSTMWGMGMLMPLAVEGVYLYGLQQTSANMKEEAQAGDPSAYPVKDTSIWLPLAALVLYPIMVFGGKKFMETREPFEIGQWVVMYNMYQCVLNLWTVVEMIREYVVNPWYSPMYGVIPWGSRVQPGYAGFRMSWLVWVHYNNKYVELLDTLWMVLKKKNNQITFLHCYHHILLIWVWYHCCTVESGGEAWFGACVNSLIHVYMYGYYTMSLLKWDVAWMKIYMTSAQLLQFVVCLVHASFVYYQTTYGTELKGYIPWQMCADQAYVMINMLFLFGQFFYKAYLSKGKGKGINGNKVKAKAI